MCSEFKDNSICGWYRAALPLLAALSFFADSAAKSLQSCPTLCDPIDGSPPGFSVSGILQARTLKWVVISFSSAWKWKAKVNSLSGARLLATPWTAALQAPLSMGFSRQEYWSGVPLPSLKVWLGRVNSTMCVFYQRYLLGQHIQEANEFI